LEPELEGPFLKWNNYGRAVSLGKTDQHDMAGISEEEGAEDGLEGEGRGVINFIPQCFSHFTYEASDGMKLVCDLQGVWNAIDGFTLTDPVVHHRNSSSRARRNGATDKGLDGMDKFFAMHECNSWCRRLGLPHRH
jgi:hypothetical protein